MRRTLPIFFILLASAGSVQARGLLIPEEKSVPPLAMLNHQVSHHHRGPGGHHPGRTDLPQPHRPPARSDLHLPGAQGRQRPQVHHVGRRQGDDRRAGRGRQGPPDLHRHRPPHPGSRPARIHRQQPAPAARLPGPAQGRPEDRAQLHRPSPRSDNGLVEYVYPLKTDGKATAHAGEVLPQGDPQVAARRSRTSTARRTPSPSRAPNDKRGDASASRRTRRCSTRTSSSSTRLGDKDVGLTALTHRPDRRRGRLLHAADLAAGRAVARRSRCRATWCSCSTPPAACAARRWRRPGRP